MSTDTEFDKLDDFLSSDRTPDDCMQLSDLDGFLAGIAVSPDMIMPSEWLPMIWGDGQPIFENTEEAQKIVGLIFQHYGMISMTLEREPDSYQPILLRAPDGTMVAEDWSEGFFAAISLRRSSWMAIFNSENSHLIAPIASFWLDDDGHSVVPLASDRILEVQRNMIDLLPASVVAIYRFWNERRCIPTPSSRRVRPGSSPKVGRNDPCPCGSGRKYKKCCGVN